MLNTPPQKHQPIGKQKSQAASKVHPHTNAKAELK
jgi:hypothetical protein